ncbi:MAG: hypothetical protein HKM06_01865 [Spirochaetales bacterium]|nr:hypothetical protein [Spirochaetales bacterium]
MPKTRFAFWNDKTQKNRDRDIMTIKVLKKQNYRIIFVWEFAIKKAKKNKNMDELFQKISKWIIADGKFKQFK